MTTVSTVTMIMYATGKKDSRKADIEQHTKGLSNNTYKSKLLRSGCTTAESIIIYLSIGKRVE